MTFKKSISTVWITLLTLILGLVVATILALPIDLTDLEKAFYQLILLAVLVLIPLLTCILLIIGMIAVSEYFTLKNLKNDVSSLKSSLILGVFGGTIVVLLSSFLVGFYLIPTFTLLIFLGFGQLVRYQILKRNLKRQISNN